ncbi:hypothetical protein HMN09_00559000 [Mycena chlorophos]|uniref:Uncharacterized protein n=1 Tax=Mycena chlorophos TaxID=658473 RepID=A0A8H6TDX3_MYCCL|nr:hypothetical protein HMN09_00559000 [Mycena chlorophos]
MSVNAHVRYTPTTTISATASSSPRPKKRSSALSLISLAASFDSIASSATFASVSIPGSPNLNVSTGIYGHPGPSGCQCRPVPRDALPPLNQPIYIDITRTVQVFPAPVPPPFAPSLGSDEVLPRPKKGRGAPQVVLQDGRPVVSQKGFVGAIYRVVGWEPRNPALCDGWD